MPSERPPVEAIPQTVDLTKIAPLGQAAIDHNQKAEEQFGQSIRPLRLSETIIALDGNRFGFEDASVGARCLLNRLLDMPDSMLLVSDFKKVAGPSSGLARWEINIGLDPSKPVVEEAMIDGHLVWWLAPDIFLKEERGSADILERTTKKAVERWQNAATEARKKTLPIVGGILQNADPHVASADFIESTSHFWPTNTRTNKALFDTPESLQPPHPKRIVGITNLVVVNQITSDFLVKRSGEPAQEVEIFDDVTAELAGQPYERRRMALPMLNGLIYHYLDRQWIPIKALVANSKGRTPAEISDAKEIALKLDVQGTIKHREIDGESHIWVNPLHFTDHRPIRTPKEWIKLKK